MKLNIDLEMPTQRPPHPILCDECHMKHLPDDDCWEGMLPAGELPLPTLDKNLTGREMVDEDSPCADDGHPEEPKKPVIPGFAIKILEKLLEKKYNMKKGKPAPKPPKRKAKK